MKILILQQNQIQENLLEEIEKMNYKKTNDYIVFDSFHYVNFVKENKDLVSFAIEQLNRGYNIVIINYDKNNNPAELTAST